MNKVILSGRIANDFELETTPTDVSVCKFRLAVSRRYKNADGGYDADFISCVAWRSNAEFICKYFKKGDPIELTGRIETRNYEKDGQTHYITEVVVEETNFTLSKKQEDTQEAAQSTPANDGFFPEAPGDNLPF